jgi:hypothetical protein
MPKVAEFYSVNEINKPVEKRVYHDNSPCAPGRDIPQNERRAGKGGYRRCDVCISETNQGH